MLLSFAPFQALPIFGILEHGIFVCKKEMDGVEKTESSIFNKFACMKLSDMNHPEVKVGPFNTTWIKLPIKFSESLTHVAAFSVMKQVSQQKIGYSTLLQIEKYNMKLPKGWVEMADIIDTVHSLLFHSLAIQRVENERRLIPIAALQFANK